MFAVKKAFDETTTMGCFSGVRWNSHLDWVRFAGSIEQLMTEIAMRDGQWSMVNAVGPMGSLFQAQKKIAKLCEIPSYIRQLLQI